MLYTPTQHPLEKSKSLPRGHVQAWPSDDNSQEESAAAAADTDDPAEVERLQTELLRLQYENEELEALKSELEWRKRSERKEIKQLGEEMATMQTLYQYRTYSVDSSESSSDDQNDVEEVEVRVILSDPEGLKKTSINSNSSLT